MVQKQRRALFFDLKMEDWELALQSTHSPPQAAGGAALKGSLSGLGRGRSSLGAGSAVPLMRQFVARVQPLCAQPGAAAILV